MPAKPNLPVPAPLRGNEPDSFAYVSIVERLPRIGRRVLAENSYPPPVTERLEALLDEIPEGPIRFLHDTAAPDTAAWMRYVTPHLHQNWLDVPWFFAETYFYRRILEATDYFVGRELSARDPFQPHKEQSLAESDGAIRALAARFVEARARGWDEEAAATMIHIALWGNQADLSMWPSGGEGPVQQEQPADRLLADETQAAVSLLAGQVEPERIVFLMDNAALELIGDLALAMYLLDTERARTVVLHLKPDPIFVSDALPADVHATIRTLAANDDDNVLLLAQRLRHHAAHGRLQMATDRFWTSPLAAWEMPLELRRDLATTTMTVSKGDANYRRLLGDRHWPYDTPFAAIVSYFPAPLLALRTLKSEVAAGIAPERLATLAATEPDWTHSGDYGVIQLAPGPRS